MTVWTYGLDADTRRIVGGFHAVPSPGVVTVYADAAGTTPATGLLTTTGTPITGNVLQYDTTLGEFPQFTVNAVDPPDLWASVDDGPVWPLKPDTGPRLNRLELRTSGVAAPLPDPTALTDGDVLVLVRDPGQPSGFRWDLAAGTVLLTMIPLAPSPDLVPRPTLAPRGSLV